MSISQNAYISSANILKCDVAAIKAVCEVESKGTGFLPTGEPIILFEPHRFWANLIKRGIDPKLHTAGNEDILYKDWGTHPYGLTSQQHKRLAKAVKVDRTAALASASWGQFQIMGENYKQCHFELLQDFITAMYKNEDEHLRAFTYFCITNHLDKYLKERDWANFALHYNGKLYKKNNYDVKLAKAYQKWSLEK